MTDDHRGDLPLTGAPRDLSDRSSEPGPLLVTINQAASLLGVGRTTAYELIATGELEVVHIGRCARIPARALEDYVQRLREQQAS